MVKLTFLGTTSTPKHFRCPEGVHLSQASCYSTPSTCFLTTASKSTPWTSSNCWFASPSILIKSAVWEWIVTMWEVRTPLCHYGSFQSTWAVLCLALARTSTGSEAVETASGSVDGTTKDGAVLHSLRTGTCVRKLLTFLAVNKAGLVAVYTPASHKRSLPQFSGCAQPCSSAGK